MPGPNQLSGVRNGEPCPGCHTNIWGAQPKRCFVCGYDFEHPDNPANLQGPVSDQQLLERQAAALSETMDIQREIEKSATARIESMVNDFLKMNWPEDSRMWTPAFTGAAKEWWPEATFYDVHIEAAFDNTTQSWVKRITGSMDLTRQKIVGFKFDYGLKRTPGASL